MGAGLNVRAAVLIDDREEVYTWKRCRFVLNAVKAADFAFPPVLRSW